MKMEQIRPQVSIDGKHIQLQAWLVGFSHSTKNKNKKQNVAFIIFNSSIHKNHFGISVQMQLSPSLSGQSKTLKYKTQPYKKQCKKALKTGHMLRF